MKDHLSSQVAEASGLQDLLIDQLNESIRHPTIDGGRNIRAGHLRGWGLEFGGLGSSIETDPAFQHAIRLAEERGSLLPVAKLQNLFLILKYCLDGIDGDIVEFGSYKGGSAVFMGALLREWGRASRVFALDSYRGMPETDPVRDLHRQGDFIDANLGDLKDFLRVEGLEDRVLPVEGHFEDTFPGVAARIGDIALVHVDCDIYTAVTYAIGAAKSTLRRGGFLVFDDALHGSCLGAMQAIEEDLYHRERLVAEQVYPHLVFRYPPSWGSGNGTLVEAVPPLTSSDPEEDFYEKSLRLTRWTHHLEQVHADHIAQRDAALRDREDAFLDRDVALADRDSALLEREAALDARQTALADRDMALLARDTALNVRRSALAARDAALREKDAAFQARDAARDQRDVALTRWKVALQMRHDALGARDSALGALRGYEESVLGGLSALGVATRFAMVRGVSRVRHAASRTAWWCGRGLLNVFPLGEHSRKHIKDAAYRLSGSLLVGTPGHTAWTLEADGTRDAPVPRLSEAPKGSGHLAPLESGALALRQAYPYPDVQVFGSGDQYLTAKQQQVELARVLSEAERDLLRGQERRFAVEGYCSLCGVPSRFDVAHESEAPTDDASWVPNWREQLVCQRCGLNNRLRAAIQVFDFLLRPNAESRIYLSELHTPLFKRLKALYRESTEGGYPALERVAEPMPRADRSLDFILSLDVLQHVPDYEAVLREFFRSLESGGALLLSVPFAYRPDTLVRARLRADGSVEHRLDPVFHRGPASDQDGALCYYHFGWDLLDTLRRAGAREAKLVTYYSFEGANLGPEQVFFVARR